MSEQHAPHGHEPGHQAPSAEHKARGPVSIECGIITCSDTRTPETDKSGKLIRELLTQAGHRIGAYHVVKDEPSEVRDLVRQLGTQPGLEALIINGGTGISRRDSTFEAVDGLLENDCRASANSFATCPTRRSVRPRCSVAPPPGCIRGSCCSRFPARAARSAWPWKPSSFPNSRTLSGKCGNNVPSIYVFLTGTCPSVSFGIQSGR